MPVHRDQLRAQRSLTSMGKPYLFTGGPWILRTLPTPLSRHYDCLVCDCCCCPDRPRFHCHRSHRSQLHASNVSIACVLRHNPDPKEIYVTWQHGGAHRVDAGNSYGEEYRLSKSVGIFANVKQTVQFLVKKSLKGHIG